MFRLAPHIPVSLYVGQLKGDILMNNWYGHMFRIDRIDSANTRWWIDLFLFDTVIRDCLAANLKNLYMWRIHRRGKEDHTGHQFSFLYYSSPEVYDIMKSSIINHKTVEVLQGAHFLRDLLHSHKGIEIEATSDSTWSIPLQKAWPYYIMGVSQMALELIANLHDSSRTTLDVSSINDCEIYYTQLMTKLTNVWQNCGSHAFFHHINAVFGYMPVIAKPSYVAGMWASF